MYSFHRQAVKFLVFFTCICLSIKIFAAPRIPSELYNQSLIYCTNGFGFSFNPQTADMGANMNVVTDQIYDKLFELEPSSNKLKPALAERYSISDDGKVITLYLRKNVAFHSTKWFTPTRKLNAEDVIFSLNRMMGLVGDLPALNRVSDDGSAFHQTQERAYRNKANLVHFPYFESIALKKKIAGVSAVNNMTVKIELAEPDHALLSHLASQYAVILSKEYALQLNADENLSQLDTLPVGTGVYQLVSYTQNDYIRLQPNPHYWGKKAKVGNIVVDFSSDGTGRMAKFLNKECDIVAFPEPSQLTQVKPSQIVENDGANLAFIAFNMQRPAVQDLALRQQISKAIDRKRIADKLFFGSASVAEQILPKTLWQQAYSKGNFDVSFKPQRVQKPLVFWVVDEKRVFNLHPMKMAEMIKSALAQQGIEVQLKAVSRAYVIQQNDIGNADYDLILTGWLANNSDPNGFLAPILSCASQYDMTNLANWCRPIFDFWLNIAKLSKDVKVRDTMYQLMQSKIASEVPIIPIVNTKRLLLVNDRVDNVEVSPYGQVRLADLRLKINKQN